MKIVVTVQATDILKRVYTIEVGNGQQYISWLAQTACLKFGQDHYPSGVYVPTFLTKADSIDIALESDDADQVPHPRYVLFTFDYAFRKRIIEEF